MLLSIQSEIQSPKKILARIEPAKPIANPIAVPRPGQNAVPIVVVTLDNADKIIIYQLSFSSLHTSASTCLEPLALVSNVKFAYLA